MHLYWLILKSKEYRVNKLALGGEEVNEYKQEVIYLLVNDSEERVEVSYGDKFFELPLIGKRPPYYAYPKYEPNYPII